MCDEAKSQPTRINDADNSGNRVTNTECIKFKLDLVRFLLTLWVVRQNSVAL